MHFIMEEELSKNLLNYLQETKLQEVTACFFAGELSTQNAGAAPVFSSCVLTETFSVQKMFTSHLKTLEEAKSLQLNVEENKTVVNISTE